MTNNKGITLIALVITIIVLLILAGVSIAMLTGDNGILNQANKAKADTARAEVVERVNMELNAQLSHAMAGENFDEKTKIESNIGTLSNGATVTATVVQTSGGQKGSVTIAVSGVDGLTTTTGKVAYETNAWKLTPVK